MIVNKPIFRVLRRADFRIAGGSVTVATAATVAAIYAQLQLLLTVLLPFLILVLGMLALLLHEQQQLHRSVQERLRTPVPSAFSFEVYLNYKELQSDKLGLLLSNAHWLFNLLYGIKEGWLQRDQQSDVTLNLTQRLRAATDGALLIDYVVTGDSIKWRAKTGWKPTVSHDGDDTYICVPTGPFIAFYLGILLAGAVKFGTSVTKDIIEIKGSLQQQQKIEMEIDDLRNKRHLREKQERKLDLEIQDLEKKLLSAPPQVREEVDRHIDIFLSLTMRNESILRYSIEPMAFGHTIKVEEATNTMDTGGE